MKPAKWWLLLLGSTLVAGGAAHLFGVIRLYLAAGVPGMNRILIDLWVGQAQLTGGGFYLAAARAASRGGRWQTWALAGAITVLGWTSLVLPILFSRAPVTFRVPATAYFLASLWIFGQVLWSRSPVAPAGTAR